MAHGLNRTIEVSGAAFDKLAFAARISGKTVAQIVDELVIAGEPAQVLAADDVPAGQLSIFKIYRGNRFDGFFDPVTEAVTLTTPPFAGEVFRTPTAAAVAVVKQINPERENPETNGFRFFKTINGLLLDAVRRG